jgi:excisionase family DNA binding protein
MSRRFSTLGPQQALPGAALHPSRLLTIPEVAEILAVKPVTVRLWLSKGRLPRTKLGRCVRIAAGDVERFIQANTTPAR